MKLPLGEAPLREFPLGEAPREITCFLYPSVVRNFDCISDLFPARNDSFGTAARFPRRRRLTAQLRRRTGLHLLLDFCQTTHQFGG